MHRVDVIVPCYNYGRYLRQCIETITSQVGVDVRVLILNDASKDDSDEVGTQLAREDRRVTYVRHTRNMGHIATYNEGLEWTEYDYTLLLSADDLLTSGALFRATQLMEAHPSIAFCFGDSIVWNDGEEPPRAPRCALEVNARVWNGEAWVKYVCRERTRFLESPAVIARTKFYKELGGYKPHLPHTADIEMWLRFAAHGDVGDIDADQAYYRIHQTNMHHGLVPTALQSLEHWKAAYDAFFEGSGSALRQEAEIREWAYGSIARLALNASQAKKYRKDLEVRRKLVQFAEQTSPEVVSAKGRFEAGYKTGHTLQPWAVRKIAGAPAYLYRRVGTHAWRGVRAVAELDPRAAVFESGRVSGYATLILESWLGKAGNDDGSTTAATDSWPVRLSAGGSTAV